MTTAAPALRRVIPAARTYVRDLWSRREFAVYLALGNLKARNASTTLGLLWWVIDPLLLGAIYGLVFGIIFDARSGTPTYVAYLLAGMFAFHYTRSAMVGGVNSIVNNTRLLANLKFPRLVLPFSALVEAAFGFAASLLAFYVIAWPLDGVHPTGTLGWLVPAFAIQTVFSFGLGALVARVAVPFRDVNNLVPYVLRLWLYLSPVIYPISFIERVPDGLEFFVRFNPMFPLLAMYRHALIGATYPLQASEVIAATGWALFFLVVGVTVFVKYEGRMTRYL